MAWAFGLTLQVFREFFESAPNGDQYMVEVEFLLDVTVAVLREGSTGRWDGLRGIGEPPEGPEFDFDIDWPEGWPCERTLKALTAQERERLYELATEQYEASR